MAQIRISRTQSWIFLWGGVCHIHLGQTRCFGLRTVRASCCKRNIFRKTLWKMRNRNFRLFWDDFVLGCMKGLDIKCRSIVRDPSFWPALHTPQRFSGFPRTIYHLLWAHWTAGFTARPPDIESTACNTIFQVSNRTICRILDRSGGFWKNYKGGKFCWILIWVTI